MLGLRAVLFAVLVCVSVALPSQWLADTENEVAASEPVRLLVAMKYDESGARAVQKILHAVSDPSSPRYGQYHTRKELAAIMGPSRSDCEIVMNWFHRHGANMVKPMGECAYVDITMPVAEVEAFFEVKMERFRNKFFPDQVILRSPREETIPAAISSQVSYIAGLSRFPDLQTSSLSQMKRYVPNLDMSVAASNSTAPKLTSLLWAGAQEMIVQGVVPVCQSGKSSSNPNPCSSDGPAIVKFAFRLEESRTGKVISVSSAPAPFQCASVGCNIAINSYAIQPYATYMVQVSSVYADGSTSDSATYKFPVLATPFLTPSLVRDLYGVPPTMGANPTSGNSGVGVGENWPIMRFIPSDLLQFQEVMGMSQVPAEQGGPAGNRTMHIGEGEGDLDIQWANGMAGRVPHVFYMVEGMPDFIAKWAAAMLDDSNPPLVSSLSWATSGNGTFETQYKQRTDQDLMQMGVMGLTVIGASGDAGVTNVGHGAPDCKEFRPMYPSESPYVTCVAASVMSKNTLPVCTQSLYNGLITSACSEVGSVPVCPAAGVSWSSGGGFSSYAVRSTDAPWQMSAVEGYLNQSTVVFPPGEYYNATNRGYPDVSVVGQNQIVSLNGELQITGGTSASAPIFAGMLALINNERIARGQPSLGFVNPLLYAAAATSPSAFRDMTVGDNRCGTLQCCEYGFDAAAGWDSVSGLGAPNFPVLLQAALEAGANARQQH